MLVFIISGLFSLNELHFKFVSLTPQTLFDNASSSSFLSKHPTFSGWNNNSQQWF